MYQMVHLFKQLILLLKYIFDSSKSYILSHIPHVLTSINFELGLTTEEMYA